MFFQYIPKYIRAREVTKQSWGSTEYTPRLTGTCGAYWRNTTVKEKLDSLCKNIRTDMNYIINSTLNVSSSGYRKNEIPSTIFNSQKLMTEIL